MIIRKGAVLFIIINLLISVASAQEGVVDDSASEAAEWHLDSPPDVNGWGFDLGFGSQPYMDSVLKFGLFTPYLFTTDYGANYRLGLDYLAKNSSALNMKSIADVSLNIEMNNRIYRDLVYGYAKLGLGVLLVDDDLYKDTILTMPLAVGAQMITANTKMGVQSWFAEFRYMLTNYDRKKSIPSLPTTYVDEKVINSISLMVGLRQSF